MSSNIAPLILSAVVTINLTIGLATFYLMAYRELMNRREAVIPATVRRSNPMFGLHA